jgi:glycosyltransferase involved in cell wall biosynthesis
MSDTVSGPPLISIVTPSLNMVKYLAATIDSVLSQDYPRIEYIVMDGGSTDGSRELLAAYGERLRFTSGSDRGPADAIHSGFQAANGQILAWLNADDTYQPGAVRTAVAYLESHPQIDVVYGEGNWIDEHGTPIRRYPTQPFDNKVLARDCMICQPSSFFRASAYHRCSLDPEVNPSFDYDLWIRMSRQGLRFAHIPDFLANSRLHGGAISIREREAVFRSSMDVLRRHYGYVPLPWLLGYTAFRIDGRDQVFEPLRVSPRKYLASLAFGLTMNRGKRWRFVGEWSLAPLVGAWRRAGRVLASSRFRG